MTAFSYHIASCEKLIDVHNRYLLLRYLRLHFVGFYNFLCACLFSFRNINVLQFNMETVWKRQVCSKQLPSHVVTRRYHKYCAVENVIKEFKYP